MNQKVKFALTPQAWKKGTGAINDGLDKIFPQVGPPMQVVAQGSFNYFLVRGADGYLTPIYPGDPFIAHDENNVPYISGMVEYRNELTYTEDFSTNWTLTRMEKTVADVISPEGKNNAYLFKSNDVINSTYQVTQTTPGTMASNARFQASVWVKQYGANTKMMLRLKSATTNNENQFYFDFTTETIGEQTASGSSLVTGTKVEKYNDGWYRIMLYGANDATAQQWQMFLMTLTEGTTNPVNQPSQKYECGFYAYGPQFIFEDGSTGTDTVQPSSYIHDYIPNVDATLNPTDKIRAQVTGINSMANVAHEGMLYIDLQAHSQTPISNDQGASTLMVGSSGSYRVAVQIIANANYLRLLYQDAGSNIIVEDVSQLNTAGWERDVRNQVLMTWSATRNQYQIYVNGAVVLSGSFDAFNLSDLSTSNWNEISFSGDAGSASLTFFARLYGLLVAEYDETLKQKLIQLTT